MPRWINDWDPEDVAFWERTGKRIARRNLIGSIVAENIGFSVWLVWSVIAERLPRAGFSYTTDQLFFLVALPGLTGALMRFPYTFAVPRFGGRNWTVISALLLLIPTVTMALLVSRPSTPFWAMALAASTAGFGGGNFASSMANISFFYPDREKGLALGLNAAGGNMGVSMVQFAVPMVLGPAGVACVAASCRPLAWAGLMWIPLIVVAALGAWRYMDNLGSARSTFRDQIAVAKRPYTWAVAWLYVGSFGSFVGYAAAFPLLLRAQFPEVAGPPAFLGGLIGAAARPFGGLLADSFRGARVTLWAFIAMAAAALGVLASLGTHSYEGFFTAFLVLFLATGIGNGSTFRMIPALVRADALEGVQESPGRVPDAVMAKALAGAGRDSAAIIGLSSAIGALGGYIIPQGLSASIRATGKPTVAIAAFIVFYGSCIVLTWRTSIRSARLVSSLPRRRESSRFARYSG